MSAILISRFNLRDGNSFADYMTAARSSAREYGAEPVFSGTVNRQLRGLEPLDHVLVVRFPSSQTINDWFDSEATRRLEELRERAADMTMVSYG